jgi:hypothetical protein
VLCRFCVRFPVRCQLLPISSVCTDFVRRRRFRTRFLCTLTNLARNGCLRLVAPSHRRTSGPVAWILVSSFAFTCRPIFTGCRFPFGCCCRPRKGQQFVLNYTARFTNSLPFCGPSCSRTSREVCEWTKLELFRALEFKGLSLVRTRGLGRLFTSLTKLASSLGFSLSKVSAQLPCFGFRRCSPLALGCVTRRLKVLLGGSFRRLRVSIGTCVVWPNVLWCWLHC